MSASITRTMTEYTIAAFAPTFENGEFVTTCVGRIEGYTASSLTEQQARDALRAAGYKVTRGAHIEVKAGATHKYTMTVDAFIANATEVIEG